MKILVVESYAARRALVNYLDGRTVVGRSSIFRMPKGAGGLTL